MLLAKLGSGVAYALAYFVTALVLVALLLGLAAMVRGVALSVGPETVTALWQAPVALVLNAVLGVAVGALVRSQVAAITGVLIWYFVVEGIIATLAPAAGRWLPFQALNSLFLDQEAAQAALEAGVIVFTPLVALAVFLAYVATASASAVAMLRTRDV